MHTKTDWGGTRLLTSDFLRHKRFKSYRGQARDKHSLLQPIIPNLQLWHQLEGFYGFLCVFLSLCVCVCVLSNSTQAWGFRGFIKVSSDCLLAADPGEYPTFQSKWTCFCHVWSHDPNQSLWNMGWNLPLISPGLVLHFSYVFKFLNPFYLSFQFLIYVTMYWWITLYCIEVYGTIPFYMNTMLNYTVYKLYTMMLNYDVNLLKATSIITVHASGLKNNKQL